MFLRRLILENVRCIGQLDLSFAGADGKPREWTFLLGENGSGKSTILRSLALLTAGSDALPELLDKPESWIRLGARKCRMSAELVTAEGQTRNVEIRLERNDAMRTVFDRNRESLDRLDRALAHSNRNYFTVGYGGSRRFSPDRARGFGKVDLFEHPRARSVGTMFLPDATLAPIDEWALNLDYSRPKQGLQVIKHALADLLPDVTFDHIDKKRRCLMFKTLDGTVPLAQLGDGYQNLAAWCGDLLFHITGVFANYRNPLKARGLLLIDGVDLHLHPVWKRRLVSYLDDKLPNLQKVVTTHSAVTVHQAGEGELYVLKRSGPDKTPRLHAFEGEPRKLMLHQLMLSPLIGLPTVDSLQVQEMRAEYRQLSRKKVLSRSEKLSFSKLRGQLEELPDWSAPGRGDEKKTELLQKIQKAMQARGGSPNPKRKGK